MKYKTIPVIVDAVPYEFGLEDGFRRYNEYVSADGHTFSEELRSKKYPRYNRCFDKIIYEALHNPYTDWIPYIDTPAGIENIYKEDMIIINDEGKRTVLNSYLFKKTYEKVE